MRMYLDSTGLGHGPRACRVLVSYLRKDALTWWRSYSKDDLRIFDTITLDVLIDALENHFCDVDRDMKLRSKLFSMR